jgi:PAS domain S-box-containing protein
MTSPDQAMIGSYNSGLVVLSVCIAMVASYAALDLAGRVTSASGRTRLWWLGGGATAMGIGIWAMHYIGMLAFRLPVPVKYDWPTVLLSLVAAILASVVALFVVSRQRMGFLSAAIGSIFMGGGIAAMHYIGMAAMRLPAMCRYSPALVATSVMLAVGISFVAIRLAFHHRGDTTEWGRRRIPSALVMGAAIPVMHYTGMAAARFAPSVSVGDVAHAVSISSISAASIVIVTFMVLGLVVLTSMADRRFSIQSLKLESSEQRYRHIIETAFDAFVGMDASGSITDWNDQAEAMFGWPRSEALGQSFSRMIVFDSDAMTDGQGFQDFIASANGPLLKRRVEMTAVHKDGHKFPVELSISRVAAGQTHLPVVFIHDVTMRNRAEMALRQAEQKYRGIVEESIVGIFQTSPDGRVLSANPAFARMCGYDSAEKMTAACQDLGRQVYVDPGRREIFKRLIEKEGVVRDFEYQVRGKNGIPIWISENARVVRDGEGAVLYYTGTVQDITDRKRSQEKLEQEIVERKRAEAAAEEASRVKSEFLANMSHEIRTPLNGIMGMTDLALESNLTSEQREYLETVKMSADSLLIVINDILDFSKMEAHSMVLDVADFNLRDRLEATLKTLAVRAHEKNLELLCEIAPEVPEVVRGDANRLWQVIINLVGNAIKFTETGEVGLNVQILLPANGDHQVVHFTVSDTGIGIPPDKQELIFHPFIQADVSTTRKYGGTGLGLAISNRLVEMMDGKMWVESRPGQGTQFHFTVELGIADTQAAGVAVTSSPEILRGVKVLLVDDNSTNRRILQGMMKHWEMKPVAVESAEEALAELSTALAAGKAYRLILTDMHMPGIDGFTLIERIRNSPHLDTAAIMMLTSAGHRGDAERCRKLAIAAYLLKPVRQSELREAISQVLRPRPTRSVTPLITRYSLHEAQEPRKSLRILVAEDNAVNQRLAARILQKRGHLVTVAADGRKVLAALAQGNFDLILMDLQMPEIDGLQATTIIREGEKTSGKHIPIIAVTAHAMASDRERCLAAGMDGYVTKPLQTIELFSAIETFFLNSPPSPERTRSAVGG